MGHLVLAEAVAAATDEGGHLGRVDLVHLGAEEDQGGRDFLIVVLVEDEAQLGEAPQVGHGQVEGGLGHVDLPAQPHDPLGSPPPVPLLDRLDRRTRTVVWLLPQLERGQRRRLVQLSVLRGEVRRVVVAHLHLFLLISIIFYIAEAPA